MEASTKAKIIYLRCLISYMKAILHNNNNNNNHNNDKIRINQMIIIDNQSK